MTDAAVRHPRERLVGLVVAGLALGLAIQIRLGRHDGLALGLALLGAALVAWSLRGGSGVAGAPGPGRGVRRLARVVLLVQAGALVPLVSDALSGAPTWHLQVAAIAGIVALTGAWELLRDELDSPVFGSVLLLAGLSALGVLWLANIVTTIDVLGFQNEGARRLLAWQDPWAPGYPNPYGEGGSAAFYGPGLADGDRVLFGFPYPPLSLLLSTVGYVFGDVRFAHLVALLAAGLMLVHMVGDSWASRAGGVLFLSTPMLLPVAQRGFTEAFLVATLVGAVFVLRRGWGGGAVALGLFLAAKQYAVLFLPVLAVVAPGLGKRRARWRLAWRAIAVAAVVTVPLALWNLPEFLFSVGLLQFEQPFRPDSMSLLALVARHWEGVPTGWFLPVTATGLVLALWGVLRTAPRTWRGAVTGVAVVQLVFLLLNKQAFTNYYLFAIAAVWLAVSLHDASGEPGRAPDGHRQ